MDVLVEGFVHGRHVFERKCRMADRLLVHVSAVKADVLVRETTKAHVESPLLLSFILLLYLADTIELHRVDLDLVV